MFFTRLVGDFEKKKIIPRSAERGILCLYSLFFQLRSDVGAVHTDSVGIVIGMTDRHELKGVRRRVEVDSKATIEVTPVICSENEQITFQLQTAAFEVVSFMTGNLA